MTIFYLIIFLISVVFSVFYVVKWNKRYNIYFTLLFCLIPFSCYGYFQTEIAETVGTYILGTKLIYLGGCFCMLATTLNIMELCHVKMKRVYKFILFLLSLFSYLSVLTIGSFSFFYKSVTLTFTADLGRVVTKNYGVGHTIFHILVVFSFVLAILALFEGYRRSDKVSRITVLLLFIMMLISGFFYIAARLPVYIPEMTPLGYVIAQVVFLLIADRLVLYDMDSSVIDVSVQRGQIGVVSFDTKLRYLGSNDVAKEFFPDLVDLPVDKNVTQDPNKIASHFVEWIREVKESPEVVEKIYRKNGHVFKILGDEMMDNGRVRGYTFMINDDTEEQEYKRLLKNYNESLESDVEQKTKHIVEMYDRIVMGMVDVVESRDINTGGHVRRSSHGVRILVGEMKKDPSLKLTDKFCEDVIKAAPMHDLGKIAVDDAVLRKKGRFTDEEYAMMKIHPAKGAEILHNVLEPLEDQEFARIAENVAHYHHERPDGKGYPDHLKGDEIPLEARIMAIADVYDALVSKRCYKDRMSFEEADRIMLDGMGSQFDASLEPYYIAAREKLEAYYLKCFEDDDDTKGLN